MFKYEGDGTTLQSCFGYKLSANMSCSIAEYVVNALQIYCNVCVTSFEAFSKPVSQTCCKFVVHVLQICREYVANPLQNATVLQHTVRFLSKLKVEDLKISGWEL